MPELPAEGGTLDQLQTPEQVALLDAIDDLRSEGLGHHGISLPQLIVCGDQSSGKSSLLEALTRLRFPTDAGCCTIFATEVILRRDTDIEISVEIVPSSEGRSMEERSVLSEYKRTYSTREDFDFRSLHTEVKLLMGGGVMPGKGVFFKDVLRVRYSGPDMPSFTIVDLPGVMKHQFGGGDGVKKVSDLVISYMEKERSIILAVVTAATDAENSQIFGYLDRCDPKRLRTLGIITKPDCAAKGSAMEKSFVRLARNEEHPMKYHWHTVRNRAFEERDQSDTERDETELKFFNNGPWASIPRKHVGVAALRAKLSHVLLEHISMELPSLVSAVRCAADATESSLKALGNTRETTREQRAYLTGHAEGFQALTNDALRGIYSNRFFSLKTPDEQIPTRLRTSIQNLNIAFAHVMYQKGHSWDIVPDHVAIDKVANGDMATQPVAHQYAIWFEDAQRMTRTECLENHIGQYVRQSRPSGLPSLVNPWVIGDVFRHQSQNWSKIAKHHLEEVYHAVKVYIDEALGSLIDPRTRNLLMLKQIQPDLERRWVNVEAKLEELLMPYTEMDPITYDPGFLRDLEEMRASRYRANIESHPSGGQFPFTFQGSNSRSATSSSSQRLLTESLDDFTNSEILDLMQTYYKTAISVFINNIAVLAIENCLIKDLSAIFSPTLTANMDDGQLHAIAAESEEVRQEREALQKKLNVLQSGKRILHEHIALTPTTRPTVPKPTREARGVTPSSQDHGVSITPTTKMNQNSTEGLTANFNSFFVTPPSSGSSSRRTSLGRRDSVQSATPSKDVAKKRPARSPLRKPLHSDEEL